MKRKLRTIVIFALVLFAIVYGLKILGLHSFIMDTGAKQTERYTIQTYTVSVACLNGKNRTFKTEEAIFKLDSHMGSVWRMNSNSFQRISVRDLASQNGYTASQDEQLFILTCCISIL